MYPRVLVAIFLFAAAGLHAQRKRPNDKDPQKKSDGSGSTAPKKIRYFSTGENAWSAVFRKKRQNVEKKWVGLAMQRRLKETTAKEIIHQVRKENDISDGYFNDAPEEDREDFMNGFLREYDDRLRHAFDEIDHAYSFFKSRISLEEFIKQVGK